MSLSSSSSLQDPPPAPRQISLTRATHPRPHGPPKLVWWQEPYHLYHAAPLSTLRLPRSIRGRNGRQCLLLIDITHVAVRRLLMP